LLVIRTALHQDFSDLSKVLKEVTVEAALNAELNDHLEYDKHQASNANNRRNGHSSKTPDQ